MRIVGIIYEDAKQFMGRILRIVESIFYESRGNLRVAWWALSSVDNV